MSPWGQNAKNSPGANLVRCAPTKRTSTRSVATSLIGQYSTLNSWRLMLGDSDLGGGRHLQAASYWQMDSMYAPTLFGLFAVTAMLFCYGLEGRSH